MTASYFGTIGLEVHAELKTATKMFCNSKNDTLEKRPNVNICAICLGHPGTLPTVNKEAVKHVIKIGVAVGGEIADYTEFDRKNYFYPDIPKGYQISQYEFPLVKGGTLAGVKLTRVHLEEDTAKSFHPEGEGDFSLVDFNRSGVPLMELVTEPVISSAETAVAFAKELQLLLRYLGVAEANMEKGEMRVEANISVSQNREKFGTKVEVKNLNSFRSVERAIKFELDRQEKLLESGGEVKQETRGWDENKEVTFSQRMKEESHDYRYFPDPDIPKLRVSFLKEFNKENILKEIPELPTSRYERFVKDYDLREGEARKFVDDFELGNFFESIVRDFKDKKLTRLAANYILSDLLGLIKVDGGSDFNTANKIRTEDFAELIEMTGKGEISSRGAKDILKIMHEEGGDPQAIAKEKGLIQSSNIGDLEPVILKVLSDNAKVFNDYKSGKAAALQFLIGQAMRATKGAANPEMIKKILETK